MSMMSISVTITNYDGGSPNVYYQVSKEEEVDMENKNIPEDKLARVRFSTGMTINLGDYQSANVNISLELPSHEDEIETTYEKTAEFVQDKLYEEIGSLQSLKKG